MFGRIRARNQKFIYKNKETRIPVWKRKEKL